MVRLTFTERLADLWRDEFYDRRTERCVLCANTGMIHDAKRRPRYCCICPTGRTLAREIPILEKLNDTRPNEVTVRAGSSIVPPVVKGDARPLDDGTAPRGQGGHLALSAQREAHAASGQVEHS